MNLNGARVLVAGATGVLGEVPIAEPAAREPHLALVGRDPARLAQASQAHHGAPIALFEAYGPGSCARAVHEAAAGLGGLDAVATVCGSVAFGRAEEVGDEFAGHLMAGNVLAPAAFFRAALGIMRPGSVVAAVTGVVVERPQARTADHSASKAALSAWLAAVRRDVRTAGIRVLGVRPGHLETGFADRSAAGTAPPVPAVGAPRRVAVALADALSSDTEPVRTAPDGTPVGTPVVERHAR